MSTFQVRPRLSLAKTFQATAAGSLSCFYGRPQQMPKWRWHKSLPLSLHVLWRSHAWRHEDIWMGMQWDNSHSQNSKILLILFMIHCSWLDCPSALVHLSASEFGFAWSLGSWELPCHRATYSVLKTMFPWGNRSPLFWSSCQRAFNSVRHSIRCNSAWLLVLLDRRVICSLWLWYFLGNFGR